MIRRVPPNFPVLTFAKDRYDSMGMNQRATVGTD